MTRADALEQLAAAIAGLRPGHPARVAIDGVDGAGKTMLADELVEPLRRVGRQVVRASVDGFHNPRAVRCARGRDSPEGYFLDSFDYPALKRELLEPLGPTGDGGDAAVTRGSYERRYVPGQRLYLAQCRPSEQANIVFDNTVLDRPKVVIRDAG